MNRIEKTWLKIRPLWAFDFSEGRFDTGVGWRQRRPHMGGLYWSWGLKRWVPYKVGYIFGEIERCGR